MNSLHLIIRNIRFYARSWILVAAGVVLGTTVLTGALITGDSVKYSLEQKVTLRLGKTQYALASPDKFFRLALGREISDSLKYPVVPLLLSDGMAINPDRKISLNRVNVIGADENFSSLWDQPAGISHRIFPQNDEAIVSRNLAYRLNLKSGDIFLLKIRKEGFAPFNAPFVYEKSLTAAVRLKVKSIADDCSGGSFSLQNNQSSPENVFISQQLLASILEMPGFVNILLVSAESPEINSEKLVRVLQCFWTYRDAGLVLKKLRDFNTDKRGRAHTGESTEKPLREDLCQLSSQRVFIQDTLATAILQGLPASEGILTYLVNDIISKGKSTPYSFVSAMASGPDGKRLNGNEIIINNWLASDLQVKAGDSITLRYFIAGLSGTLREKSTVFIIKSITDIHSVPFSMDLMPDFPGIKNTLNCRDWETGTMVDLSRIRDKDEYYWKQYKGTPKAFISLEQGRKLWQNPFGSYTAFRFTSTEKNVLLQTKAIMGRISPAALGLAFRPVHEEGLHSAQNSTDFGELFLSLGALIVISGLLLSGMLFSFFLQNRTEEAGLLYTIGFRKRKLIRLFLFETLIFIIAGSLAGTGLAIGYTRLILYALNTVWQGAVHTSMLTIHIRPEALIIGFLSGILISLIVLSGVLFKNLRRPPASVIKKHGTAGITNTVNRKRISLIITILSFAASAVILIAGMTRGRSFSSPVFMAAGSLFLLGMASFIYYRLIHYRSDYSDENKGLLRLVLQNAGINRSRTVTAVTMFALGTFTILITGANRKIIGSDIQDNHSGTGGFLYWIQTTVPFRIDLNSMAGRTKTGLEDEPLVQKINFVNLYTVRGDDASCLNLNRVKNPQLIGVPCGLFEGLHAFSFTGLDNGTDGRHPWQGLQDQKAGDVIPGYADQTVITWGLEKKIGDTIQYWDEAGNVFGVRLAGGLDNSIFQGNILVSDSLLRKYYPSTSNTTIILARGGGRNPDLSGRGGGRNPDLSGRDGGRNPESQAGGVAKNEEPLARGGADIPDSLARLLETRLYEYGAVVTPAASRLAEFNSVENTYLSVFMMLGGLGVLLGTIGLAVLLLKNLLERRFEVALYTALGFPEKLRKRLIFSEYFFILLSGLTIGITAAFIGSLPTILYSARSISWIFTTGLIALVFFNGIFWIYIAIRTLPRSDPAKILRSE
jgi:ABC-type antimicrobial peptide transport system permease subunit